MLGINPLKPLIKTSKEDFDQFAAKFLEKNYREYKEVYKNNKKEFRLKYGYY